MCYNKYVMKEQTIELIGDEETCPYCDGYLDKGVCYNADCIDGVED